MFQLLPGWVFSRIGFLVILNLYKHIRKAFAIIHEVTHGRGILGQKDYFCLSYS